VNQSDEVQVRQCALELQKRLNTDLPNADLESEVLDLIDAFRNDPYLWK
jgi:hypothetical protein